MRGSSIAGLLPGLLLVLAIRCIPPVHAQFPYGTKPPVKPLACSSNEATVQLCSVGKVKGPFLGDIHPGKAACCRTDAGHELQMLHAAHAGCLDLNRLEFHINNTYCVKCSVMWAACDTSKGNVCTAGSCSLVASIAVRVVVWSSSSSAVVYGQLVPMVNRHFNGLQQTAAIGCSSISDFNFRLHTLMTRKALCCTSLSSSPLLDTALPTL